MLLIKFVAVSVGIVNSIVHASFQERCQKI